MKLGLIKSALQLLTGAGVGMIADHAIDMVKPKNLTGIKKISVKLGGFVLSSMAAGKAIDYVEEKWNEAEQEIQKFIPQPEQNTETEEVKEDEFIETVEAEEVDEA